MTTIASAKDLEQKIEEIVIDCLITGKAERLSENPTYGNHMYWVDQLVSICVEYAEEEKKKKLQELNINLKDLNKRYDMRLKQAKEIEEKNKQKNALYEEQINLLKERIDMFERKTTVERAEQRERNK